MKGLRTHALRIGIVYGTDEDDELTSDAKDHLEVSPSTEDEAQKGQLHEFELEASGENDSTNQRRESKDYLQCI